MIELSATEKINSEEKVEVSENLNRYGFELIHTQDEQDHVVGRAVFYSNASLIVEEVKIGFVLIVINSS